MVADRDQRRRREPPDLDPHALGAQGGCREARGAGSGCHAVAEVRLDDHEGGLAVNTIRAPEPSRRLRVGKRAWHVPQMEPDQRPERIAVGKGWVEHQGAIHPASGFGAAAGVASKPPRVGQRFGGYWCYGARPRESRGYWRAARPRW